MKKKLLSILLLGIIIISTIGCNISARQFGGSMTVDLPKGKKLIECTWKENSLWYLTRDMKENDIEEIYEFKEDSQWGAIEGTVTIKEHK